jgi:RNA-binding protein YlmH
MAKRTKTAVNSERLGVAEERLDNVVSQMPEIREDLKTVLSELGKINVTIATLPTWDAVKAMDKEQKEDIEAAKVRLTTLETAATRVSTAVKVGWGAVVIVSIILSTLIGWGVSFLH